MTDEKNGNLENESLETEEEIKVEDIAKKAEEQEEESVGLAKHRTLKGKFVPHLFTALACIFALLFIYFAYFGYPNPQLSRGIYLGGILTLGFMLFPATKNSPKHAPSILDWILIILANICCYYFIILYEDIVFRGAEVNPFEMAISVIGILLCLEITRRVIGNFMVIIALVFLAYAFLGPHVPGLLAHRGYSFARIVSFQWFTVYGVFGVVTAIFANFVFLFVILGTVLDRFGAAKFFIELPYALVGRTRGGPAKAAVLVSGFVGSISGSAVANVTTTGTFTIPLMKKTGYKPFVAGAVEAAASSGGQIMPPIMGAGAFLIAEFANIPYVQVVLVSIGPAILYYLSVLWMVHLEAVHEGLQGLKKEDLPNLLNVFKQGWFYSVPFIIIFYLLIRGYSPGLAAFWAIVSIFVIGMTLPHTRLKLTQFINMLETASRRGILIGSLAGTIGLVIGVVQLTGLGLKISEFIVDLSGGILPLAIVLVGITSYILGMGLTVTSSYIILAVLAVPALTLLGIPGLAAHLIVFWFSQAANVTPPVCLAAFAGAGIAGAPPMKTGWQSLLFARGFLIIPFMFAYHAAFILAEPFHIVLLQYIFVGLGLVALGCTFKGCFVVEMKLWERALSAVGAFLLFSTSYLFNVLGLLLVVLVYLYQRFVSGKHKYEEVKAEIEAS